MRNPEILAPAGTMEALIAALRCGADAVYVGAKDYSARNSAVNFDLPALEQACQLCHLYHAKLHLAVNTLLTDSELENFQIFIRQAVESGIDACIVQDLGVLKIIKSIIPDLPLHASTQMSIYSCEGALQAKQLGCSRVVLARELSCEDLKLICKLPVETEVFVHGATCMSVSGQCHFSSIVGGRSANRGKCGQACRLPWHTPEGNYLSALSLKDLSLVKHVNLLKQIGVDSFKIEGRMKRPEYVACAVTALRMALNGKQPDMKLLQSVFSRSGFTDGYFTGKKQAMFGYRRKEDVLAGQQVFSGIQASYQKPRVITELDFNLKLQKEQPALLQVSDSQGNHAIIQGAVPELAKKLPLQTEGLKKYLQKLGGTIYQCGEVKLENPDDLILSASQCNALRRDAVEQINALRQKKPNYQISENNLLTIPARTIQKNSIQKRLHIRT
ncbi:MAG: U32 family peptidase, partial [Oscillospiraceae bacterium]|nr:U32 family peptidase [Oscillospiraceae bacterium]